MTRRSLFSWCVGLVGIVAFVAASSSALGQTQVVAAQGKPGSPLAPWPVTCTNCGSVDGGTALVVVIDGGAVAVYGIDGGYPVTTRPASTQFGLDAGNVTLTAATVTQVFAGGANICGVTCQNIDSVNGARCGQKNNCDALTCQEVFPGGEYVSADFYGGAIWCYPLAGTPTFTCQANECP